MTTTRFARPQSTAQTADAFSNVDPDSLFEATITLVFITK